MRSADFSVSRPGSRDNPVSIALAAFQPDGVSTLKWLSTRRRKPTRPTLDL